MKVGGRSPTKTGYHHLCEMVSVHARLRFTYYTLHFASVTFEKGVFSLTSALVLWEVQISQTVRRTGPMWEGFLLLR